MKVLLNILTQERWNEFLKFHDYAHSWHSWEWGEFLERNKSRSILRFAFEDGGEIAGLYQLCTKPIYRFGREAESMPVHHFGGPIVKPDITGKKRLNLYEYIVKSVDAQMRCLDIMHHVVKIWDPMLNDDGVGIWKAAGYINTDSTTYIYRMPQLLSDLDSMYRYKFRDTIKRGIQKGGSVVTGSNVDSKQIYDLYLMSMTNANIRPRYSFEEVKYVLDMDPSRRDVFVAVDSNGNYAGFSIYLRFNRMAIYWLSGMNRDSRHINPMNLIVGEFLKAAYDSGIKIVDFGGGGNKGLEHFKSSIGATPEKVHVFRKIYTRKKYFVLKMLSDIRNIATPSSSLI